MLKLVLVGLVQVLLVWFKAPGSENITWYSGVVPLVVVVLRQVFVALKEDDPGTHLSKFGGTNAVQRKRTKTS